LKPLKIIQPAEVELAKETTWYRDRDPRVASRFTSEVRKTLKLIETFPQIGSQVFGINDPAVRSLPVHGFPYQIVFVTLSDRIEVVAFAHKRRRPAYFVRRLRRS